ncbi:unnamed protein product [Adineta steineri]|uniref:Uncharacterized protein n=1 Tax=Adineta steineri TaxID=433720 RepID=A0A818UBP7_9BILA|nr:unnamed protein product [Adineta steineri]CAF3694867.1 unnamed protein product [Adineta steineri]
MLKNSSLVCFCQNNDSCPLPANLYLYKTFETFGIYDLNRIKANETLFDIITDCLPYQMALSSSLECFYNQSCLNILLSSYKNALSISILNQSLSSRFLSTKKIDLFVDELFLEEMFNKTNYIKYYSQCLPINYSRDPLRIYHSLLATQLHIILFSYSPNEIFNETIINPSGQEYEKLEEKYSSTLTRPCTQISIPHRDLTTIDISQITINNATKKCLNQIFINTKLISESKFNVQIENIILQI